MIYGYVRCSTDENKQSVESQINVLSNFGEVKILQEYESGTLWDRPILNKILKQIKKGDMLIVTEVSRLTRSLHQLLHLIELAIEKQFIISCGSINLDCTSSSPDYTTLAMLQMVGVFSELEVNNTRARIINGLVTAKASGKSFGRPKTTIADIPSTVKLLYPHYVQGKFNKSEYAKRCKISRNTLNKYLAIMTEASRNK